ncbi:MAG: carboxypeptidase-like regulatory domain-containing protein [Planctomycetota bacterium]|nr:carboxypeptidase-like regulatory domain-containing protein [Planctomycetota bacterium]MDA1214853.1 carboxypeptidase-like regulatory domain-containing protein [Planctomycetota bacterium]
MTRNLLALALFTSLIGCGESVNENPLPETVSAAGIVTFDGNPLSFAQVIFVPTGETKGVECIGTTDESGKYTLKQQHGEKEGAPPGSYKVVISCPKSGDGTPAFKPGSDGEEGAPMGASIESLPLIYSDHGATTLTATVPGGGSDTINFELVSK